MSTTVGEVTPVVVVSFLLTTTVSSITVYPPCGCYVVLTAALVSTVVVGVVTLAPATGET